MSPERAPSDDLAFLDELAAASSQPPEPELHPDLAQPNQTGRKTGRPSTYTLAKALEICDRLAGGESLRAICLDETMPHGSTVYRWLQAEPTFCDHYVRARESWTEAMAEEILEIADDAAADFIMTEDGPKYDREHVDRAKLKIDSRKWLMARRAPKKFGDKLALEVTTEAKELTDDQLMARLGNLMERMKAGPVPGAGGPS